MSWWLRSGSLTSPPLSCSLTQVLILPRIIGKRCCLSAIMYQHIVQESSGGTQHFNLCDHLCSISACLPDVLYGAHKSEVVFCCLDKRGVQGCAWYFEGQTVAVQLMLTWQHGSSVKNPPQVFPFGKEKAFQLFNIYLTWHQQAKCFQSHHWNKTIHVR